MGPLTRTTYLALALFANIAFAREGAQASSNLDSAQVEKTDAIAASKKIGKEKQKEGITKADRTPEPSSDEIKSKQDKNKKEQEIGKDQIPAKTKILNELSRPIPRQFPRWDSEQDPNYIDKHEEPEKQSFFSRNFATSLVTGAVLITGAVAGFSYFSQKSKRNNSDESLDSTEDDELNYENTASVEGEDDEDEDLSEQKSDSSSELSMDSWLSIRETKNDKPLNSRFDKYNGPNSGNFKEQESSPVKAWKPIRPKQIYAKKPSQDKIIGILTKEAVHKKASQELGPVGKIVHWKSDLIEDTTNKISRKKVRDQWNADDIARYILKRWPRATQRRTQVILDEMAQRSIFLPRIHTIDEALLIHRMHRNGIELWNFNKLGSGGFGTTYKIDFEGKRYAVKISSKNMESKFIAKELAALEQIPVRPNITKYYGAFKQGNLWHLVFELGESDLANALSSNTLRIPMKITKNHMLGLLDAVLDIHERNIAHRDLKPENILVVDDTLKLADFGAAYSYKKAGHDFVGTKNYFGPELTIFSFIENNKRHQLMHLYEKERIGDLFELLFIFEGANKNSTLKDCTEAVWPGFQYLSIYEKGKKYLELSEKYDPRSGDIFALGRILKDLNLSFVPANLIKTMLSPNPLKRPTIYEVIERMKKDGQHYLYSYYKF